MAHLQMYPRSFLQVDAIHRYEYQAIVCCQCFALSFCLIALALKFIIWGFQLFALRNTSHSSRVLPSSLLAWILIIAMVCFAFSLYFPLISIKIANISRTSLLIVQHSNYNLCPTSMLLFVCKDLVFFNWSPSLGLVQRLPLCHYYLQLPRR